MWTSFITPGLADINALVIMGANAGKDEESIGFFGTGFKYAMALLARAGCEVEVQIGMERRSLHTEPKFIRGETFDAIYLGDIPMNITTKLAKNWKPWMAFRELMSNTIDEDGWVDEGYAYGHENCTVIRVRDSSALEFSVFYRRRAEYFLDPARVPVAEFKGVKCFEPDGIMRRVFWKTVCIHESDKLTYDYAFPPKTDFTLTEERQLQSEWDLRYELRRLSDDWHPELFEYALITQGSLEYTALSEKTFMDTMPEWQKDLILKHKGNENLVSSARHYLKQLDYNRPPRHATPDECVYLEAATRHLDVMGFQLRHDVRVHPSELSADTLGMAMNNQIVLFPAAFNAGLRELLKTLIEEELHLRTGASDFTRKMQEAFLQTIIETYVSLTKTVL